MWGPLFHPPLKAIATAGRETSLFIGIDKVALQFGMTVADGQSWIKPQHHERGGIGIRHSTSRGKNGGWKDGMLHRITCSRINGMGILLTIGELP